MDPLHATLNSLPARNTPEARERLRLILFWGVLAVISAALLAYSQTMSFVWDEGFHLVAAQLINAGKTPYIDFCFPQTLLNAYWNAGLMLLFGENWRVTHYAATALLIAAVILMADFVRRRFPVPHWRLACGITAACMIGLDVVAVQFGTVAQAYAMGLFFTVAAFRAAVASVDRRTWLMGFLSGLLAGAAANATLLTAAAAPFWCESLR